MSVLTSALSERSDRRAAEADAGTAARNRMIALLQRAEPLGKAWAEKYTTAWGLDENIRRDIQAWSTQTSRDIVRHLRPPQASLAVGAVAVLFVGSANLITTLLLLPRVGVLAASLLAASGVMVSLLGMQLAHRYIGVLAQHRAGIPPFRLQLQQELQRQATAALHSRRERLAGPRRPIPRHPFPDLLPAQAQNIAAGWMRHLGELDATVLNPDDGHETVRGLHPGQAHLISTGYVGRVWWFTAQTPERELALLEDAAKATGRRPVLFSLSGFSDAMIARANRRGIGLLTFKPWSGVVVGHGLSGQRYLRQGLRDSEGMAG